MTHVVEAAATVFLDQSYILTNMVSKLCRDKRGYKFYFGQ